MCIRGIPGVETIDLLSLREVRIQHKYFISKNVGSWVKEEPW